MFEYIRVHQLDIMLSLSSICGMIAFFVLITGLTTRKKTAMFLLELGAMILLISDRLAYLYDGSASKIAFWTVRISDFMEFVISLEVIFAFAMYLQELIADNVECSGKLIRFRIAYIILIIGSILVVISQFTGMYYSFNEQNQYHRNSLYFISYIAPLSSLGILLSIIIQYYRRLSKNTRFCLLIFTFTPLSAAIFQFFVYGISATNIALVGTVVLLYIFDLVYVSKAAAESERALAASKAKSAFLSNMSHEIRTPINAILGMNEMILRESENDSIIAYSENIKTAGSTLLGLINDILDFSKIEAGKIEIIPVEYDISMMINDLVNMIQLRAEEKGLIIKLEFDNTLPKILRGDEVRIKQVIINILTNAVKYTEKGSITFHIGYNRLEKDADRVMLHVSVKDTGIGIKQSEIQKLYVEFERIDEFRNRTIEGTGLGMTITKTLLEMMNGTLHVDSVYGQGSTFYFDLEQEVVDWEPLGDYTSAYHTLVNGRKKYKEKFFAPSAEILVVDDNQMNLVVFGNLLKQTRVKIELADSGDKCLALSSHKQYDLIFLDHMMPEKDGIETLHELRAQKANPNGNTPIICLTANAVSGAREQYIEAGFDDYLTKPIDPARLEDVVMQYLPKEKIEFQEVSEDDIQDCDRQLPEKLRALPEQKLIDFEDGMMNSGSEEAYMPLLQIFYESIDEKKEEIERFYETGDILNYTIKVHALKSSARIIGAKEFGEDAQRLEDAGKIGDMEYIREHQQAFITTCGQCKTLLSGVFETQEDMVSKPLADMRLMKDAYEEIKAAAEEMDCERLELVFTKMKEYSIPETEVELFDKLAAASDRFEYEKITQLLAE